MRVSGWLNIDKPLNYSSAKVVSIVKKLLRAKKVGHGGTLDPQATGVLPICLNEATKTVNYIMHDKKSYVFHITFGEERDTGDAEGKVIKICSKIPSLEEIKRVIPNFLGEIQQIPPIYSAIKVDGKRAYELARKGENPELSSRMAEVFDLKCSGFLPVDKKTIECKIECGKGFYIRSFGRDFAGALGSCGYISKLERTKVGIFIKENSISLEQLEKVVKSETIDDCLIPIRESLHGLEEIEMDVKNAKILKNGGFLRKTDYNFREDQVYKVISNNEIVCLVKYDQGCLKPVRVFNLY